MPKNRHFIVAAKSGGELSQSDQLLCIRGIKKLTCSINQEALLWTSEVFIGQDWANVWSGLVDKLKKRLAKDSIFGCPRRALLVRVLK
jgi:hypothetical protein